ncbi:hypothetical protein KAR48_03745 [bacterium]|nr:hypothetical protein [bacterium]
MKNTCIIGALFIAILFSCKAVDRINYHAIQGYYKYLIFDCSNDMVVDTLYSTTIITGQVEDTIKFDQNITGILFGTKDKIYKLWDVSLFEGKKCAQYYPVYVSCLGKGDSWNLEYEAGFTSSTLEVVYTCLSSDTAIFFDTGNILQNVTLIEKKDWIDVGGLWGITHYGYDSQHRLVYVNKFTLNPRDDTIVERSGCLVLNIFIPQNKVNISSVQKWVSRNSIEARSWFFGEEKFEDDPPPPKPPF